MYDTRMSEYSVELLRSQSNTIMKATRIMMINIIFFFSRLFPLQFYCFSRVEYGIKYDFHEFINPFSSTGRLVILFAWYLRLFGHCKWFNSSKNSCKLVKHSEIWFKKINFSACAYIWSKIKETNCNMTKKIFSIYSKEIFQKSPPKN